MQTSDEGLADMLVDAAEELRSEGMVALATAVDVARERLSSVAPASGVRLAAFDDEQLTLEGMGC